mmetsp:Transcript_22775/g.25313  ORF Transcript_22775/g.25313 Transcript_22775/m.25313 type:complete len:172 (+) Transcript_22775:202-717(+)
MRGEDASYTIAEGTSAQAFGMMLSCSTPTCSDSLSAGSNLLGGTVAYSSNTYTWTAGTDVSNTNVGNTGTGTALTTTYGLRADSEIWSNIPVEDSTAFLRCWAQYNVGAAIGNINNAALDVTSWNEDTVTVAVTTSQLSSSTASVTLGNLGNGVRPILGLVLVSIYSLIFN